MNNKLFRIAIPLAVSAATLLSACEQLGLKDTSAFNDRLVHTCKDPNPGNIFREPDGGYHESFQGWFYKAEIHQGTSGPASAYCYYGLDKIAPANRPVYSVH